MSEGVSKEKLAEIVGRGNVLDDPETLEAYSKDESFMPPRKPFFVVTVRDADEIESVVKLANASRTPLIPVSSGPPRFRGDTVPEYGGIVVDLSRMSAIRFVDRPDRVAMIEPGVRFAELQSALRKEGLKLPVPLCPRDTKSVLASFLEREPHTIPKYHLDHTEPLLCAEVVYGTGDLFRTGEGGGPGTIEEKQEVGWRQKLKLEPQTELVRVLQGSQGTMGIVTWVTVRCEVMPSVQRAFLATGEGLGSLLEFAYRLTRLRIADELLILNAKNISSIMARGAADVDKLSDALPAWLLLFSVSGYHYFPAERLDLQEKEAKRIARTLDVSAESSITGINAENVLETVTTPCDGVYWKLREKGGCQDIAFLSSYNDVAKHVSIMEECASRHGFRPADAGVYVQPVCQGHAYHCEFSLFYNRADPSTRRKVRDLYLSLGTTLMANGAFFSRPYDLLADHAFRRDAVTRETLKKVKDVFDPANILNPGKLCF